MLTFNSVQKASRGRHFSSPLLSSLLHHTGDVGCVCNAIRIWTELKSGVKGKEKERESVSGLSQKEWKKPMIVGCCFWGKEGFSASSNATMPFVIGGADPRAALTTQSKKNRYEKSPGSHNSTLVHL